MKIEECPCKDCITFPICRSKNRLDCSLLYTYLGYRDYSEEVRKEKLLERLFKRVVMTKGVYLNNNQTVNLWIQWMPKEPTIEENEI